MPSARAAWWAALVAVPVALAGISLLWPGPVAATVPTAALAAPTVATADVRPATAAPAGATAPAPAAAPVAAAATAAPAAAPLTAARAAAPATAAPATAGSATAGSATAGSTTAAPAPATVPAVTPVTFDADSAELSAPAEDAVERVAAVLRGSPTARARLTGHCADTPGPVAVAQRLSERRASAVADRLTAAGIDRARLTTVGRGNAEPLSTPAASRRVEFEIS